MGNKPTIAGDNPLGVETHLLNFNRNIYGSHIKVEFLKRVRPELRFSSVEELKHQMQEDIAFAGRFFAGY